MQSEEYQTYDLGCASALVSAGFEIASIDKTNLRKVQFKFHKEIKLEETVEKYWADKLKINARTFFDNVKMLKNRIYSE